MGKAKYGSQTATRDMYYWQKDINDLIMKAKNAWPMEVGDLVKGNSKSDIAYGQTNSEMTLGEIVAIRPSGRIDIKVLEHSNAHQIGVTFPSLRPQHFDYVYSDNEKINFSIVVK